MKWSLSLSLALLLGTAAVAVCPAPSSAVVVRKVVKDVAVVQHAVVAPVVTPLVTPVAVYQPVTIAVPAYSASYVPGVPAAPAAAVPAAPPMPGADQAAILKALQAIEARLTALEKGGARPVDPFNPGAPPAATAPPGPARGKLTAIFAAKCNQCHQRGKETDGGNFVLTEPDGSLTKLDPRAQLATVRRSYSGTMPPKSSKVPPLTDEEVAEILANLK